MPYSLIVAIIFGAFTIQAHAQSSIELMCRNQAKEVAAETYKNCVTENKQVQIEKIRKEYQSKLNDLKDHYDKELKKLSGQAKSSSNEATPKTSVKVSQKRASGARGLPEKNVAVKTEVIDMTSDSQVGSMNNSGASDSNVEVVEIPTE